MADSRDVVESHSTAVITALHVYPVKGCRSVALHDAELARTGLRFDRHWMAVDPAGDFVTQRELPHMALIRTSLDEASLVLNAPGMEPLALPVAASGDRVPVTIWSDRCFGLDQGHAAAAWFSRFLGRPLRLVRFDQSVARRGAAQHAADAGADAEFADAHALLIASEASLADLNRRLARPLPMNRFRPNIVISGLDAYGEDHLQALRNETVELRIVAPCTRCRVTTVDQDTAEIGEEPLHTLLAYRRRAAPEAVTFGQKAAVVRGAGERLRIGDRLETVWNF